MSHLQFMQVVIYPQAENIKTKYIYNVYSTLQQLTYPYNMVKLEDSHIWINYFLFKMVMIAYIIVTVNCSFDNFNEIYLFLSIFPEITI